MRESKLDERPTEAGTRRGITKGPPELWDDSGPIRSGPSDGEFPFRLIQCMEQKSVLDKKITLMLRPMRRQRAALPIGEFRFF